MQIKRYIIEGIAAVIFLGGLNLLRNYLKDKWKPWVVNLLVFFIALVIVFIVAAIIVQFNL